MIANVSPSSETFEDTFNTLKYADRAKKIKTNLKKNVMNVDFHVAQYAKIVEDLRGEISQLKERIQELEKENSALKVSQPGGVAEGDEAMEVVGSETDSSTNVENDKSKELETLQKTLNRYIERQKDYDDLVRRVEEFESLSKEQETKISQFEIKSKGQESEKVDREVSEYKKRIRELESRLKEKTDSPHTDGKLERLVEERKKLISKILSEESSLVNLEMRVNFKKKVEERNVKITIGQKLIDKSNANTSKAVETLTKKVEKKKENLKSLLEEMRKNEADLEEARESSQDPQACKSAQLEIELLEARAQSRHLNSMISIMGHKLETQDQDLNSTLAVLRKNHVCLRGYELATKEDQKQYEELRSQLMEKKLRWCNTLEEFSDQEPEITPVQFYTEASQLSLPSLTLKEPLERPRSREEDTDDTASTTASTCVPEENTVVETTLLDQSSPVPPPCRSEKAVFAPAESHLSFPALPPTPNLLPQSGEDLLPTTPIIFGNHSFEILPATPQPSVAAPLIRKQSDLSFVKTPDMPGQGNPSGESLSTPKRSSEADHSEGSASKKPKLLSHINWEVHRETTDIHIPDTPQAAQGSRTLNETFDSQPDSPQQTGPSSSLNETITLESNMVEKCDIRPAKPLVENLNSTFAVEVSSECF